MTSTTRAARQSRVVDLLARHEVRSQGELLTLLAEEGIDVTQATLSRDLGEVGAVKVRRGRSLVYAVPGHGGELPAAADRDELPARLKRACEELLVSARATANQVVVRTPPGAANYLASCIDQTHLGEVVGTIAGDDTILLITTTTSTGRTVAKRLLDLTGAPD